MAEVGKYDYAWVDPLGQHPEGRVMNKPRTGYYANGDLVRQRMFELVLSERELANRATIGQATLRSILNNNTISEATPLAIVNALAQAVGLTMTDLLQPPEPDPLPDDTPEADVAHLTALLCRAHTTVSRDRLAAALQWTLPRLAAAEAELDLVLAPLGPCVNRNSAGLSIRTKDAGLKPIWQRLELMRDAQDTMHNGMARTLYSVFTDSLSKTQIRNNDSVQLGALINRGAVTVKATSEGHRVQLSEAALFAFDVD